MHSKNKKTPSVLAGAWIALVKMLPCSVCDEGGGEGAPSEAHEIKQGQWFTICALCASCHRGALMGLHGQRRIWVLKKMDETDALAVTIERIFSQQKQPVAHARRAQAAIN